ncbi:MaoC family dehydratase [Streptomyces afghaniensis]|uniref:MaoC family dehydratase n=1 Tax=Streptomyces afghaniensis TaxID=66865 RepID=UPI0033A78612
MRSRRADDEVSTRLDNCYFEDYTQGATYEYDGITVTQDDIIDFATRFDPQSFHVDPAAAQHGPFGGLIASGWHTTAVMMRLLADNYLSTVASLGSPGVDELRWLAPVRPGDHLWLRVRTLDTRLSRSAPNRGIVRSLVELLNQDDLPVLRLTVVNLLSTRPNP